MLRIAHRGSTVRSREGQANHHRAILWAINTDHMTTFIVACRAALSIHVDHLHFRYPDKLFCNPPPPPSSLSVFCFGNKYTLGAFSPFYKVMLFHSINKLEHIIVVMSIDGHIEA